MYWRDIESVHMARYIVGKSCRNCEKAKECMKLALSSKYDEHKAFTKLNRMYPVNHDALITEFSELMKGYESNVI